jgi:hypothetical protein
MTHRMLSKNSASSRAIPVEKLIKDVIADPYIPLVWGKNQTGMQAFSFLEGEELETAQAIWEAAMHDAVRSATGLAAVKAHKQIVNRILEPFSHITVLCSGTEWSNFLGLRDHSAAEPHIQILAREIRKCLENDPIQDLKPGEWHLPFVDRTQIKDPIKLSVARCASTSYKTVDGFDMTLEKAIEIHDKLIGSTPLHASPAEHVAYADHWGRFFGVGESWDKPNYHGNFIGFCQYRKTLPNESL